MDLQKQEEDVTYVNDQTGKTHIYSERCHHLEIYEHNWTISST